jgi:uncharacterized protein (TIGR03086 family)
VGDHHLVVLGELMVRPIGLVGRYGAAMSENLRNYVKSIYGFDHVLRLMPEKALTRKAPCAGWTGKDVIEHAIGGVKMVQSFAATGKGPKSPPKLGPDPKGAWAKLRDATLAALDQPGALQAMVNEPFGPDFGSMPMDDFLPVMGADLIVHAWDLARTAKVDEQLDPALCKITMATWKGLPEAVLRSPGFFDPAVKSVKGADAQTRMLNFLGREV